MFTSLTVGKPTLIREVVVPNLPTTITHILNICRPSKAAAAAQDNNTPQFVVEEETICPALESLRDLIRSHGVTFRPFAQKTHTLALSILSSPMTSRNTEKLAREVFASLHLCASGSHRGGVGGGGSALAATDRSTHSSWGSKDKAVSEEWSRGLKAVMQEIHTLFDALFRSILEGRHRSEAGGAANGGEATSDGGPSAIGLEDWEGSMQGLGRAGTMLRLVQSFVNNSTSLQVAVPLGQLVDLTVRIFGISPSTAEVNAAVERSERDILFARLPEVQGSALDLVAALVRRLGRQFAPFSLAVIEQLVYLFGEAGWDSGVRAGVYNLLTLLLDPFGTGLDKPTVHSIHLILQAACDDLMPLPPPAAATNLAPPQGKSGQGGKRKNQQSVHADSFLSSSSSHSELKLALPGLVFAAETLIATSLARLPTAYIRSELRTKLDRTAILTCNSDAMVASVLFPAPQKGKVKGTSILPHLVGASNTDSLQVEGIVRPRLPIIWVGRRPETLGDGEEEEEEDQGNEDDGDDTHMEEEEEEENANPDRYNSLERPPVTTTLTPNPQPEIQGTGSRVRPSESPQDPEPSPKRQRTEPDHAPPTMPTPPPPARYTISEKQVPSAKQAAVETTVPPPTLAFSAPPPVTRNEGPLQLPEDPKKGKAADLGYRERQGGAGTDSDDEMEIPEIDLGSSSEDELDG